MTHDAYHPAADPAKPEKIGGLARYFVEKREVAWVFLVMTLIWGIYAYRQLGQQEDPTIPIRSSVMLTEFAGATSDKVEELVTAKLEKKITELQSVNEVSSESRDGVSVINIALHPGIKNVDQEWDKIRAKVTEVVLPEGCRPPFLDADFGKTITLLFAVTSPDISDGEAHARANMISQALLRISGSNRVDRGHAAIVEFFPPTISGEYRRKLASQFERMIRSQGFSDTRGLDGPSFSILEFSSQNTREQLQQLISRFAREHFASDELLSPDMELPLILLAGDDPLAAVRRNHPPRYTCRELEIMAEMLENDLKQISSVGRVIKIGVLNEQLYLYFSQAKIAGYELSADNVLNAIRTRNALIPGGILQTDQQNIPVELSGTYLNIDDLRNTVVGLAANQTPVYLRDLFDIRRAYEDPPSMMTVVYHRDKSTAGSKTDRGKMKSAPLAPARSILVAVEMKEGEKIHEFNADVRNVMARTRQRLAPGTEIITISDQPAAVADKLHHFIRSFIEAVAIVVLVALLLMDWRSALVVATAIPLTVALTIGGMQLFSIPLHQISVAALIIALGLLVDDPVVAADGINREMAHGASREVSAWLGPWKLRRPIFFATLINIFAFLPLVLLPDETGEFIFAIPVVVSISLVASRLVSMTFVPLLGYYILRGQKGLESAGGRPRPFWPMRWIDVGLMRLMPRYRAFLASALRRPFAALAVAYGIFLASFGLVPFFGTQFFPSADRNQFLIDIELPEGASMQSAQKTCVEIMETVRRHAEIANAAAFIGGTAPCFFYNVVPRSPSPRLAQILINTATADIAPALIAELRVELDQIAGARCIVKALEQGPPVGAPIQIRISGPDLNQLCALAGKAAEALRNAGGYKVHDDLGLQTPKLHISIDQDRANTLGVQNAQIGQTLQAAFAGLKVTELREGEHLVPVVARLASDERNQAGAARNLYVETAAGKMVPLSSFADIEIKPQFANVPHFQQLRAVTVKSYAPTGVLPSAILERARPAIQDIIAPPGYKIDFAGEDRELNKSANSMIGVVLVSIALIALTMVIQFQSLIKSITVLVTVPLGLIGTFVGLAVSASSMGFMAMLAVVSLTGVIISHIIVLSDFIEEAREKGVDLEDALIQAGLARLRPVLVTVLATVGGLIPLFLYGGSLWHALTAVHIFGLLFATVLTLVVLPVIYFLFCRHFHWIK